MCPNYVPVFFDLETTGFSDEHDEIIQIGAINEYKEVFCRYILPNKNIPSKVSEVTGFEKINNKLYHRGQRMETTPIEEALRDFVEYLRQEQRPIILVGHNCISFDCRFLLRDYIDYDLLRKLGPIMDGFTDSLSLFKKCLPGRNSYKLADLAWEILGYRPESHEAVEDATTLLNIFRKKHLFSEIYPRSRSFDDVLDEVEDRIHARKNGY